MILLSDAHAHLGSQAELEERKNTPIPSLLSAGTPEEAERLFQLLDRKPDGRAFFSGSLLPACGIHPWYADRYTTEEILPYLEKAPVIGEIGMDSIWCQVPLPVQEAMFRTQLSLACRLHKPVVLHTKGQEKNIAAILQEYPNRYLVHWYSCEDNLEDYRKLDCYFSIGPDVWWNPAVQNVALQVPLHRLLIETDGLEAVRWAREQAPEDLRTLTGTTKIPADIASSLHLTLHTVASLRTLTPEEAGKLFCRNLFHGFLANQFPLIY